MKNSLIPVILPTNIDKRTIEVSKRHYDITTTEAIVLPLLYRQHIIVNIELFYHFTNSDDTVCFLLTVFLRTTNNPHYEPIYSPNLFRTNL